MVVWSLFRLLLRKALIHQSTRRFLQNWCLRHGNDFMTHSSYLLASPTDGFAKAQLMSQCLPYLPTDLSPYLPYIPYQRLKPERKSVVLGTGVLESLDLGGSRIIKQK